jgi:hypothetical protein
MKIQDISAQIALIQVLNRNGNRIVCIEEKEGEYYTWWVVNEFTPYNNNEGNGESLLPYHKLTGFDISDIFQHLTGNVEETAIIARIVDILQNRQAQELTLHRGYRYKIYNFANGGI